MISRRESLNPGIGGIKITTIEVKINRLVTKGWKI
jgi:hypothetical protein